MGENNHQPAITHLGLHVENTHRTRQEGHRQPVRLRVEDQRLHGRGFNPEIVL